MLEESFAETVVQCRIKLYDYAVKSYPKDKEIATIFVAALLTVELHVWGLTCG